MSDLTDFLLARIADDEAVAKSIDTGAWEDAVSTSRRFDHVWRWSPARVLAECEAKRRIVALHTGQHECVGIKYGKPDCVLVAPGFMYEDDPTLLLLATPYTDHPDYREEWKP